MFEWVTQKHDVRYGSSSVNSKIHVKSDLCMMNPKLVDPGELKYDTNSISTDASGRSGYSNLLFI